MGTIHLFDRNLKSKTFTAYSKRVNHLKHCKPNFLVAVGDDETPACQDLIKIYNMDKYESTTDEYTMVCKPINIFTKSKIPPSPITFIEVNAEFTIIALGLGSGVIVLIQGDLSRGKVQHKVLLGNNHRITGLHLRKLVGSGSNYNLYCTTPETIFKYQISGTKIESMKELDQIGCEIGCSILSNEGDLIIARKEGLWFYKLEGKGGCLAFEGKKLMLKWYRTYCIVISSDLNRQNVLQQVITIYDLQNKYIAFRFSSDRIQVSNILQEFGSLFIIVRSEEHT